MTEWRMHAADHGDYWTGVGSEWYARAHGGTATPVLVTEDPDGDYLGWVDAKDEAEGDDRPGLICIKEIFSIQFTYGVKAEVDRGRGRVVPVRIERIEDEG